MVSKSLERLKAIKPSSTKENMSSKHALHIYIEKGPLEPLIADKVFSSIKPRRRKVLLAKMRKRELPKDYAEKFIDYTLSTVDQLINGLPMERIFAMGEIKKIEMEVELTALYEVMPFLLAGSASYMSPNNTAARLTLDFLEWYSLVNSDESRLFNDSLIFTLTSNDFFKGGVKTLSLLDKEKPEEPLLQAALEISRPSLEVYSKLLTEFPSDLALPQLALLYYYPIEDIRKMFRKTWRSLVKHRPVMWYKMSNTFQRYSVARDILTILFQEHYRWITSLFPFLFDTSLIEEPSIKDTLNEIISRKHS